MIDVRRIWAEFLPLERLREPTLLRTLAGRSVQPLVAALPRDIERVGASARAAREAGAGFGLWPMLDDREGRWLNIHNVGAFRVHLERLLTAMDRMGTQPDEVVFDLEPPISRVRAVVRGRPRGPGAFGGGIRKADGAVDTIATMVTELRRRGIRSLAAVVPVVLWDRGIGDGRLGGWQRLLGTPVAGVGFDRVCVMAYTSLLEGYVPGIRRADARALLFATSRRARRTLGRRATIELGLTGGGALGDERSYRSVDELRDDVALVRAAGIGDIGLHGLAGACARGGAGRWLDVLVGTSAARRPPASTWRSAAVAAGLSAGSTGVDVLFRPGRARGARRRRGETEGRPRSAPRLDDLVEAEPGDPHADGDQQPRARRPDEGELPRRSRDDRQRTDE